jgi:hypothetical protein
MSGVEKPEEIKLGMAYLNKNEICDQFWARLRNNNK